MPLWFPIAWSVAHPTQGVPYELWILWHAANIANGEGFKPAPEGITLDLPLAA